MVEHQPSKLDTWVRFPSPAFFLLYRTAHGGPSPSGKAQDFDSCIRRFESGRPSFSPEDFGGIFFLHGGYGAVG